MNVHDKWTFLDFSFSKGFPKKGQREMEAECSPFYSLPSSPRFWQLIFCDVSFSNQNWRIIAMTKQIF